jgi:hypothetical protein
MKRILTAAAAVALSGAMMVGAQHEAKADGGAVAVGVAAYLVVDAVVGQQCHINTWPINMIRSVVDQIHGRPGCYSGHRRHHRHH